MALQRKTSAPFLLYNDSVQPLLSTKTCIPPPGPRLIERPRLLALVGEGARRALTLISAPAGFGKTTLAAAWARRAPGRVAWLSLQPSEHSRERFLTYLIQALQTAAPQVGQTTLALLQQAALDGALEALVNDLDQVQGEFSLVLDDFHTIDGPETGAMLQFLLENRPASFHLLLTTRQAPSLNLARLRALDQVTEIGAAELRFSEAEMRTFLETSMELHLPEEQIARLHHTSEGWAVGLQLAGLALERQPDDQQIFAGQEQIFDYLAEEVLQRQPPEIQEFLRISALFDRFSAALCDAVLGELQQAAPAPGRAAGLIKAIGRANLFLVPLDATATWFRYHALFGDFLRRQLPAGQAGDCYRTASRWFEQNGLTDDAIHYACHASDFERAAGLIESGYRQLLLRGEQAALLEWLACLPPETIAARPRLALAKAWAGVIAFDVETAAQAAAQAEASLEATQSDPALHGELKSLRILMGAFQGRLPPPEQLSQAFILLSEQDDFLHGLLHFNLGLTHILRAEPVPALEAFAEAMHLAEKQNTHLIAIAAGTQLGEQYQVHGELARAERVFLRTIDYTQKHLGERSVLLGMPFVSYADLLREQNRFDEAIQFAGRGIRYCRIWQPMACLDGLLSLARLEGGRGDWEACYARFDQAIELSENTETIIDDTFVVVLRIRAHLLQGDLDAALHWLKTYQVDRTAPGIYLHLQEMLNLALLRGELLKAEIPPEAIAARLSALLPDIERRERRTTQIEALVLRAYALHAAQKHAGAAADLNQALKLGAQHGYLRLLADEGPRLLHLLEQYHNRLDAPGAYIRQIVRLLGGGQGHLPQPGGEAGPDYLTPLTRRELDILALIAAGKSNQEIAAERVLTLNTVKKHVSNILSKLGAANRTQAVLAARQAGWLE
jgi:LuxR family maltose regulon positive regulatory protein